MIKVGLEPRTEGFQFLRPNRSAIMPPQSKNNVPQAEQ